MLSFSNHILGQLEGSNILLQLKKEVLWHYEKSDCLAELCWFGGFREGCREFWWSFSGGLFHQQESLQSEQCHQQTQRWNQVRKSPVVWPVSLGPGIVQLVECLTERPGIILVWVWALVWQRLFSQSQLPVQTLLRCPYSPLVLSHASTSGYTLKIPNSGSHTIVWTLKYYTHVWEWVALFLWLLCLT